MPNTQTSSLPPTLSLLLLVLLLLPVFYLGHQLCKALCDASFNRTIQHAAAAAPATVVVQAAVLVIEGQAGGLGVVTAAEPA